MRDLILHTGWVNCKGDCMTIDINFLSSQLLERLANSIHDRDPKKNEFCFNIAEVQVVEKWIDETIKKIIKEMAEY
jgi:hypothetical protein